MINQNVEYVILQLSDLHIFDNTEWNVMQEAYSNLPYRDKVKCVIITGDLHQYRDDYRKTQFFLNKLLDFYCLSKKDIFIVPGNHDSGYCNNKKEYTYYIENEVDNNPDCYRDYFVDGKLIDCFSEYNSFYREFYNDYKDGNDNPEQIKVFTWIIKSILFILIQQ